MRVIDTSGDIDTLQVWRPLLGSSDSYDGFWLGLSLSRAEVHREPRQVQQMDTWSLCWGWDSDVPWSWLPSWHRCRRVLLDDGPMVQWGNLLSWLGFTFGCETAYNVAPSTAPKDS